MGARMIIGARVALGAAGMALASLGLAPNAQAAAQAAAQENTEESAKETAEPKRSPAEIIAQAGPDQWRTVNPAHMLMIEVPSGMITIELLDGAAPGHVAQMQKLVKAGFYDGLSFYRVIDGFVAQGGDVFETRELPEGTVRNLPAEIEGVFSASVMIEAAIALGKDSHTDSYAGKVGFYNGFPIASSSENPQLNWMTHCTGALAMARDADPDTGGTEFYIPLQPQRYLDRNLTIFGRVIDGMSHVQALTRQSPPEEPEDGLGDIIVQAWMGDSPPQGRTAPHWQVFKTDTKLFADYVESRRNRPESFFIYRPNSLDICQLPIPVKSDTDR